MNPAGTVIALCVSTKIENRIAMKRTLLILTAISGLLLMNGCKKEPTLVYVSNTKGAVQSTLNGSKPVHWDVHVILNGHDYGIVEEGETAGPFEIKGTKIEIEKFDPDPNCIGDVLYYRHDNIRWCLSAGEWQTKRDEWRSAKPSIALNKTELTLEIGYGEPVDND